MNQWRSFNRFDFSITEVNQRSIRRLSIFGPFTLQHNIFDAFFVLIDTDIFLASLDRSVRSICTVEEALSSSFFFYFFFCC